MSKAISKTTFGPLTVNAEDSAGVSIEIPGRDAIRVNIADLPEDVVTRLAVHGLSQKLGDSYAGAGKEEQPLVYAAKRVSEVAAQLVAGDWRVTGEGGPRETLLAKALARATGQALETCIEVLAGKQAELDNEEKLKKDNPWKQFQSALRGDPGIKEAINAIKLEEAEAAAKKGVTGEAADLSTLFQS